VKRPEAVSRGRLAAAAEAPKGAEAEAAARKSARVQYGRAAEKASPDGQAPQAAARKERAGADGRARHHAGERVLTAAEQLVAAVAGRPQAARPASASGSAGEPQKKVEGLRKDGHAEPRVVVIDLRKQQPPQPAREKPAEPAERVSRTLKDGDRDSRGLSVSVFKADRNAEPPAAAAAPQAAGRFRDALQAELVRHSTMVLRDDGATSEMRLVLKPESLGAVRIHLRMADNRIEGQIVVDNRNVRQLFESVLPSLEDGLRQQGFGSASLEVSVGHRDATGQRDLSPEARRVGPVGAPEAHARAADRWAVLRLGDGLVDLVV
jgi:flagellar hook-length control protein FliK